MRVENLDYRDGTLEVVCSGQYGVGSDGNSSADLVKTSIEQWCSDHPDQTVVQIDVDYTGVDYVWGSGPVSSMVPFFAKGVAKCRIIANLRNRYSLADLVATCRVPIEVVGQK